MHTDLQIPYPGGTLAVSIRHFRTDDLDNDDYDQRTDFRYPKAETLVEIGVFPHNQAPRFYQGVARCSVKDNFSRRKGRQIAFVRAFYAAVVGEERAFEQYLWNLAVAFVAKHEGELMNNTWTGEYAKEAQKCALLAGLAILKSKAKKANIPAPSWKELSWKEPLTR